jgi:hypothetical protein
MGTLSVRITTYQQMTVHYKEQHTTDQTDFTNVSNIPQRTLSFGHTRCVPDLAS